APWRSGSAKRAKLSSMIAERSPRPSSSSRSTRLVASACCRRCACARWSRRKASTRWSSASTSTAASASAASAAWYRSQRCQPYQPAAASNTASSINSRGQALPLRRRAGVVSSGIGVTAAVRAEGLACYRKGGTPPAAQRGCSGVGEVGRTRATGAAGPVETQPLRKLDQPVAGGHHRQRAQAAGEVGWQVEQDLLQAFAARYGQHCRPL